MSINLKPNIKKVSLSFIVLIISFFIFYKIFIALPERPEPDYSLTPSEIYKAIEEQQKLCPPMPAMIVECPRLDIFPDKSPCHSSSCTPLYKLTLLYLLMILPGIIVYLLLSITPRKDF